MATNPIGDLVKLPGEIIAKSIESLTSNTTASTQNPNTGNDQAGADEALKRQNQAKDKAALNRVMGELDQYRREKAQEAAQVRATTDQQEEQGKILKAREKQKNNGTLARFFKSISGTGEAAKIKG